MRMKSCLLEIRGCMVVEYLAVVGCGVRWGGIGWGVTYTGRVRSDCHIHCVV